MNIRIILIITSILIYNTITISQMKDSKTGSAESFSKAKINLEQNATDGDVEVVFEIQGGDEGLTKLNIISPAGETIIDFNAHGKSSLGIRQFRFESPEPKDFEGIKKAYPEGNYKFEAVSNNGQKLFGKCMLKHNLPATTEFIQPKADAKNVHTKNLNITWTKVRDIVSYIVYIEDEELNFTITMPGSKNKLTVPDGLLKSHTEYTLGIGTVSKEGNISFIETSFTTGD